MTWESDQALEQAPQSSVRSSRRTKFSDLWSKFWVVLSNQELDCTILGPFQIRIWFYEIISKVWTEHRHPGRVSICNQDYPGHLHYTLCIHYNLLNLSLVHALFRSDSVILQYEIFFMVKFFFFFFFSGKKNIKWNYSYN